MKPRRKRLAALLRRWADRLDPAAPTPRAWLSKKEIARRLGVSTSTIDNWARDGMPYRQVGGRRRFDSFAVEAWIALERFKARNG